MSWRHVGPHQATGIVPRVRSAVVACATRACGSRQPSNAGAGRLPMGAVLAWHHHRSIVVALVLMPSLVLLWQTHRNRKPPPRLVPTDAKWLLPLRSDSSESGAHIVQRRYDGDPARSWDPSWWANASNALDKADFGIGTPRSHFDAFVAARERQGRTAADCKCTDTRKDKHKAWEDRVVGCAGDPAELRSDRALIDSYAYNRRTICGPHTVPGPQGSYVTCSFHHSQFTQKNRSASICDLAHVAIKMDLLVGELMSDYSSPATPLHLERGAVTVRCGHSAGSTIDVKHRFIGPQFDWMTEVLQSTKTAAMPFHCDHTINHTVLLLSRDNNLNLFHSAEDMLQVYIAFVVLDLDPREVEIIISDLMLPGPYLEVWSRAFSRQNTNALALMRDAAAANSALSHKASICFKRLVFPPPGIGSLICQHVGASSACGDVALVQAAADYIVRALAASHAPSAAAKSRKKYNTRDRSRRPVLTMIYRKDYTANVVGEGAAGHLTHGHISNLDEVLGVLHYEYSNRLMLQTVDFATLSFHEQVEISHGTDILLGAHGAGLTHMLWMNPGSAVVEISTSYGERKNQHYRNMAGYMRHSYKRVEGMVPLLGKAGHVELKRLRAALEATLISLGLRV